MIGVPEHLNDVARESLVDLTMPGYRLDHAGFRIAIPVMLAAVPDEQASKPLNRSDQVDPLHDTTSSSTLRMPVTFPPAIS